MPMDYALLPPEVNSGRMYAGPGSGPMLAAAAAWDALAVELESTASGYSAVISGLTGKDWLGTASVSMADAATRYVAWLSATATQAEKTAIQAKEASAAYEAAFAMTVPPPVVAANRALLLALIATNFFGQNTPAIAATEVHYAEMWAQDATAMYSYAGSSAAASTLTPFSEPPQTTNPAGQGARAVALAQAVGSATGTHTQGLAHLAISPLSSSTGPAGTSTASTTDPSFWSTLGTLASFPSMMGSAGASAAGAPENLYTNMTNGLSFMREIYTSGGTPEAWTYFGSVGPYGALRGGTDFSATLGLGQATKVAALSVPPSWTAAVPEIRPVALTLPASGVGAAPAVTVGMPPGTAFGEAMMGTMSGRGALARVTERVDDDEHDQQEETGERSAIALVAPSRWLASSWAINTRRRGVG
jgi:PPE-repeat protein